MKNTHNLCGFFKLIRQYFFKDSQSSRKRQGESIARHASRMSALTLFLELRWCTTELFLEYLTEIGERTYPYIPCSLRDIELP